MANIYTSLREKFKKEFNVENPDKIIMSLVAILTFFPKEEVQKMIQIIDKETINQNSKNE